MIRRNYQLALAATLLVALPGSAGAADRPAQRVVGKGAWRFVPPVGDTAPALVYDSCPSCQPTDIEQIVARCPASGRGSIRIRLPAGTSHAGGDGVVELKLGDISVITLRGEIVPVPGGVAIERSFEVAQMPLDMAVLNDTKLVTLGTSEAIGKTGGDQALNDWRRSCRLTTGKGITSDDDWKFKPAAADAPASLALIPCATCADTAMGKLVLTCPASRGAGMSIEQWWPGAHAGQTFPITLHTSGGLSETVTGRVQQEPMLTIPVAPRDTPDLIDWLVNGNTLRVGYRSAGTMVMLPLTLGSSWREACAAAAEVPIPTAAPTEPPSSGQFLRYAGTYDIAKLLGEPAVRGTLASGLDARTMRLLRTNLQVTGPIERSGAAVVVSGQAPHAGGEEEAIVAIGLDGHPVEIGTLSKGRVDLYSPFDHLVPGSVIATWARDRGAGRPLAYHRMTSSPMHR